MTDARAEAPPYRSPLLARQGAVAGPAPDAGVALHYGDPVREQRDLVAGRAFVDLSHRGVVAVRGADRVSWLHTLSSQSVLGLAPGDGRELLLLDPHGHIEHAAALVDDGETAWLVTEAADAASLAAFLRSMRFMLRVEVDDATGERAVVGSTVAGLARLSEAAPDAIVWKDPWPVVAPGGAAYGPDDAAHPGAAHRVALALVPRAELADVAARLEGAGGRLAGTWAWEALRIEAWRPRLAREVDDRSIPHELDWLRTAVHLHKGCYRGQETVARVVNLGRPPRRLVMLHLDGTEHVLPEPGTAVLDGARDVGRLTSVTLHHELGPVGLAVIKRSVAPDAPLTVGGIAAAQETVVRPDGLSTARPPERADLPPVHSLRRRPPS